MTRRAWWITGAAVVVLACVVVAAGMLLWPKQSHTDCDTVRELFAYTKQHNDALIAKANVDEGQPSISDAQEWATRLHGFADQIRDQKLAAQTSHLADLADQQIDALERGQAGASVSPDPNLPAGHWDSVYFEVGQQFAAQANDLHAACPG
jgi:hypothetical protein